MPAQARFGGFLVAAELQYHAALAPADRAICRLLAAEIERALPEAESKVWHAIPVWFLDGNPIVGYSKLKGGIRLTNEADNFADNFSITRMASSAARFYGAALGFEPSVSLEQGVRETLAWYRENR